MTSRKLTKIYNWSFTALVFVLLFVFPYFTAYVVGFTCVIVSIFVWYIAGIAIIDFIKEKFGSGK